MSTDSEALANLLEVAEGNIQLELLFSFPLPYDVVVKYELMREKTFKKVGLPHTSSKLWRLQNEANRKLKPKIKQEEQEINTHEYVERLSISHEMTLKYARLVEESVQSLEKLSSKLSQILESSSHTFPSFSKVQDLELIYYKDLSKFKELESIEQRVLESLSSKFSDRDKDLHKSLSRIEERLNYYDKTVQNLQSHLDSCLAKSRTEKEESEARVQELLATCHNYSDQIEKLKIHTSENWEHEKKIMKSQLWASYEEKIKNLNEKMLENSIHMETQVNDRIREMANKEKKIIEKYNSTILLLETQIIELTREISLKEKRLNESLMHTEAQVIENKRELAYKEKKINEKLEDERSRLIDERSRLEDEISLLKREISKKDSELESTQSKLTSLKEELLASKSKQTEQKEEISKLKSKTDNKELLLVKSKLTESKEELAQAKSKLSDTREELSLYKTQCSNYKEENSELKNLYSDSLKLRETFMKLQETLHEIFMTYSNSHDEWQRERWKESQDDLDEVLQEVDFLAFMISKLANDNNWLVDRLAELGQENQRLKDFSSPKKQEMISELRATSNAFKGFENARSKLLYHFNEGRKDGALNY